MINFTESEIENFSIDELKHLGFFYIPWFSIVSDDASISYYGGNII